MKIIITKIFDIPFFYELNQRSFLTIAKRKKTTSFLKEIAGDNICRVLDVGCGTGLYSNVFLKNYFATDINYKYLAYIKKFKGIENIITSSAISLPLKNNTFDFIFCINVFHHLDDKVIDSVFNEMWRVCTKGGKIFLLDVVYPENKKNIIGLFLRKYDRGKYMRKREDLKYLLSRVVNNKIKFIDFRAYPHDATIAVIEK